MPFDLIAFGEATPGTGTNPLAGALNDTLYRTDGDDIQLKVSPANWYLIGSFYAACSTGARALIRQPGLGNDYCHQKCALETDLDPTQGYEHYFGRPLPLIGNEKLNVLSVNATSESTFVGLMIATAPFSQALLDSVRPTHLISGYSDTTLTAYTWTPCVVTWNQDLPKGEYAIVGMRAGNWLTGDGQTMSLTRLLIPGKTQWRPGVPAALIEADHEEYQSVTNEPWVHFPKMSDISFPNTNMPNIEVFSPGALTDENIQLLLQKIA